MFIGFEDEGNAIEFEKYLKSGAVERLLKRGFGREFFKSIDFIILFSLC